MKFQRESIKMKLCEAFLFGLGEGELYEGFAGGAGWE